MLWLCIEMCGGIKRLQLRWLIDKYYVLSRCWLPNVVQRLPQALYFLCKHEWGVMYRTSLLSTHLGVDLSLERYVIDVLCLHQLQLCLGVLVGLRRPAGRWCVAVHCATTNDAPCNVYAVHCLAALHGMVKLILVALLSLAAEHLERGMDAATFEEASIACAPL